MKFLIAAIVGIIFSLSVMAQQITQPSASNMLTLATAGSASLTGTTAETTITSIKIPANSLGKNGAIFATCLWSYPNSANSKSLIVRWSATQGGTSGILLGNATAATTTVIATTAHILRNNNATNAQLAYPASNTVPFGTGTIAANTASVDTTADAWLNINGTLASAAETLTVQHCFAWIGYSQ